MRVECPDPLHQGSKVIAKGKRLGRGVTRQVYECRPTGYPTHRFAVVINAPDRDVREAVVATQPPACLDHPGSRVVRTGMYPSRAKAAASGVARRQRYRCYPGDGSKHDFTPPLPREAVDYGHEHCPTCAALVGVHHGARASARKHPSRLSVVVATLEKVAVGMPYTRASLEAYAQLRGYRHRSTRLPRLARAGSDAAREARRHWHLAGDWVEIYGPVCWAETLAQMRATEAEQARTRDPQRPAVLVIDSVPARSKRGETVSRKRWSVLAAAQVQWGLGTPPTKQTRLRQLRALPADNSVCWRLFLDDLAPYQPEYVVTDLDRAQINATKAIWPSVNIIPSMWHMLDNLERDLRSISETLTKNEFNVDVFKPDLQRHLRTLDGAALVAMQASDWDAWWTDLATIVAACGGDPEVVRARWRRLSVDMYDLLPVLNGQPSVPLSTGGLEMRLASRVKPLLDRRQHAFANIERTNNLLDLVVCHDRGLFLDRHHVEHLIQRDNENAQGWSLEPRQVTDRMTLDPATNELHRNSSLTDYTLVERLALKRGL